jgi:hypothetical protein
VADDPLEELGIEDTHPARLDDDVGRTRLREHAASASAVAG